MDWPDHMALAPLGSMISFASLFKEDSVVVAVVVSDDDATIVGIAPTSVDVVVDVVESSA